MFKVRYERINKIETRENTRNEEFFAALAFANNLFEGKKIVIGDDLENNEPDIFAQDYSKGLEVVTCEPVEIYKKLNYRKGKMKFSKQVQNDISYESYKNYVDLAEIQKEKDFLKDYAKKNNIDPEFAREEKSKYFAMLAKNIEDKLEKLNDGSYKSCDELNLVVMSNLAPKSYLSNDDVNFLYNDLRKKYKNGFENVYIVHNDKVDKVENSINKSETSEKQIKISNEKEINPPEMR